MRIQSGTAFVIATLALVACGCGQQGAAPAGASAPGVEHSGHHHHDQWWCEEHGVPESVCALCNSKLAADFKARGDWCVEHDRPESQCFVCNPGQQAVFAALYEAKYGKQPPAPTELTQAGSHERRHDHDHDHGHDSASLPSAVK